MNKFVKILIIINGLILPALLLFALFQISNDFFRAEQNTHEGIIVGEELNEAVSENVALQGLDYDNPLTILNSENHYLPISVLTYKQAKALKRAASSAGDIGFNLRHITNVIFLDSDYNVIHTLLSKKASIADISIRQKGYRNEDSDKNHKYAIYKIGFKDTNQDGKLNNQDFHDLFISDLNGTNLTQISTDTDIVEYEFTKDYSRINIQYRERTEELVEHRRVRFAYFDIEAMTWNDCSQLNQELLELEKQLAK
jgi:hypothetical protein